jgi:hypothetical protein
MAKLKLARFSIGQAIVDIKTGAATTAFLRWLNDSVSTIQSAQNDTDQLVRDIAFSLEQAGIAITTANEAKAAAVASGREAALVNSYVDPSDAITTSLDGTTAAKITIANHTRVYGDGTSVSVTGATITGLALSSQYFLTYLDPTRTGGSVAYSASQDSSAAGQGGAQHLVGGIVTPSSTGTGGGGGGTTRPPGVPSWKFPEPEMPVID